MTVEIEVGVNLPSDQRLTLTDDDIQRLNPVLNHTGKGDLTATLRGNRNLEQFAQRQDRINVNVNGSTKWTGYLISVSHGTSTTRIRADGIGKRLEETRPDYDSIGGPLVYQNERLDAAIRDYWSRTPFSNYSVTDQTTETVATDEEIQSADTTTEWSNIVSPKSTTPIAAQNGQLELLQSCWNKEAENVLTLAGSLSDSAASEGTAESHSTISDSFSVTTDYTIPASNVGVAVRVRNLNDPNSDGSYEGNGFEVFVDGDRLLNVSDGFGLASSDYSWLTGSGTSSDVSGSTTIEFDASNSTDSYETNIDVIVLYDDRYNYTFDDTVEDGYLSGPELYPDAVTLELATESASFNITGAAVNSTWNDTTGAQSIQVSKDGSTWKPSDGTETNTSSIDVSFSNAGRSIQARFSLDRYGSRTTATPTTGFNGQAIDTYELLVDGNNLVVIDNLELSRNHFDNLQTLHEFGNFLWVIEHDSSDISNLTVSSFQRGDETRPKPDGVDNQKNQKAEIQSGTYYNSIYLEGAKDANGDRPTAEVKDSDAISNDGREISPGVLRDLSISTEAGAAYRARALLETALSNNDLVGSVTVPPTIVAPGFSRPIDFGNGEKYKTVEEVSLNLGTNSAEATFNFVVRDGFAEDISALRRSAKEQGNRI